MKKHIIIFALLVIMMIGFSQTSFAQSNVPEWVRNTATWYGQGLISEQEFLNAIKFLIDNKIILLAEKTSDPSTESPQPDKTDVIVTKPRLNYCIVVHQSWKELGDFRFKAKYSHVNYISECVKLYKDPVWKYQGNDRIDVLYKKFLEFHEQALQAKPRLSTDPYIKVQSINNLGQGHFLVKFNVCAGDLPIDKAKILIKSEIDAIQVGSSKDVPANACRSYETQIYAKHADNIKLSIIEQVIGS
jgi:hypothetical protein